MKTKFVQRTIQIICILLALGLAYGVLCYFVKSSDTEHLDAIAINPHNNEVAISFYKNDYAHIIIFDPLMNQKYAFKFDDAGGSIHEMSYDENGNLYVHLSREKYDIRIYPDGTVKKHVDIGDLKYEKYEETWEKDGSSYKKTVNGIEYVYDYAGFWEYYGTPIHILYVNNDLGTQTVWSSKN